MNKITSMLISVAISLCLCTTLTGCVSSNSTSAENESEISSSETSQNLDTDSTDSTSQSGLTLSDVLGFDGIYCLESDGNSILEIERSSSLGSSIYETDSLSYAEEYISDWELYKTGTSLRESTQEPSVNLYGSGNPVTIDRLSGDKLIAISSSKTPSISIYPVVYSGYSQPQEVSGKLGSYEEIAGIPIDDDEQTLQELSSIGIQYDIFYHKSTSGGTNKLYYTFISDTSQTVSAGWYEGTEWKEGHLPLTSPFYVALTGGLPNRAVDVELSKDGYAECDISSLNSGLYIVNNVAADICTIVEIV